MLTFSYSSIAGTCLKHEGESLSIALHAVLNWWSTWPSDKGCKYIIKAFLASCSMADFPAIFAALQRIAREHMAIHTAAFSAAKELHHPLK